MPRVVAITEPSVIVLEHSWKDGKKLTPQSRTLRIARARRQCVEAAAVVGAVDQRGSVGLAGVGVGPGAESQLGDVGFVVDGDVAGKENVSGGKSFCLGSGNGCVSGAL